MTDITDLKYAVFGLAVAAWTIVVLLAMILRNQRAGANPSAALEEAAQNAVAAIESAVAKAQEALVHGVEIAEIVGFIKELKSNPDALKNLGGYADEVLAGAFVNHINMLNFILQDRQSALRFQVQHCMTTFAARTRVEIAELMTELQEVRQTMRDLGLGQVHSVE